MPGGVLAPLRQGVFRRIWLASLLSNLGQLIQGVGAAWAMTQLTSAADKVALVQTATMLPIMLGSVPAGAIADMYDRRKVAMSGLFFALVSAASLSVIAWAGLLTPELLLIFSFLVGTGVAIFGPAWQSSVSEQVSADALPAAVALNSISYNIARSFGPAVGGMIVAAAGALAAFAANALLCLPLLIVLALWRRRQEPSRLPPEGLHRSIISGIRFVLHSPPIRIVLARTLLLGTLGASLLALMPLVVRDLLGGGALTYGIMLGMFGIGAIAGAFNVSLVRRLIGTEAMIGAASVVLGLVLLAMGFSRSPVVTGIVLVAAGGAWMLALAQFNISVQLAAPRWVSGRALASFQGAITGGMALGGWIWGRVAMAEGVAMALILSAIALICSPLAGLVLRMPVRDIGDRDDAETLADPDVRLAITGRSGPVVIELEYRIAPDEARTFYLVMLEVQRIRQRSGAFAWSLARDIADPDVWTERFQTPTWHDYLRSRNRSTRTEREVQERAFALHRGDAPVAVRRRLERPLGSVRGSAAVPDPLGAPLTPLTAAATGGMA